MEREKERKNKRGRKEWTHPSSEFASSSKVLTATVKKSARIPDVMKVFSPWIR